MANSSMQTHGDVVTVIKENELKKKLHSSIFHATMIQDNDSLAHQLVYRPTNMECVLAYFNVPYTICTNNNKLTAVTVKLVRLRLAII